MIFFHLSFFLGLRFNNGQALLKGVATAEERREEACTVISLRFLRLARALFEAAQRLGITTIPFETADDFYLSLGKRVGISLIPSAVLPLAQARLKDNIEKYGESFLPYLFSIAPGTKSDMLPSPFFIPQLVALSTRSLVGFASRSFVGSPLNFRLRFN